MKNRIRTSMLILGVALLANAGSSMATVGVLDTLNVIGYTDTGTGDVLQATGSDGRSLNWYSGSGYGIKSNISEANPEHAVDNNGNKESLLINFGASKQLNAVTVGWNNGNTYDTDITVLAWQPDQYMNPANPVVAAPTFDTSTKYSTLIGQGWNLVGNYANLQQGVATSVNVTNPVSSSYWLVMTYNSAFAFNSTNSGGASDTTAKAAFGNADTSADYGKFYSVTYSDGTKRNRVPEPSTALLLGAALFGLIGQRSSKLKV